MPPGNPDSPHTQGPSTGYESADAVAKVLEDVKQREKAQSKKAGPVGRGRGSLALIYALLVTSLYLNLGQETGPPPELEAMHSTDEAITRCREGIEFRLADRGGAEQASLEAEYLQGGEYTVRGTVSVTEGRSRVIMPVLCEAQFQPEDGWIIEHVEVGS